MKEEKQYLSYKNPCQEGRSCQWIRDGKTAAAVDFLQKSARCGITAQADQDAVVCAQFSDNSYFFELGSLARLAALCKEL